jgi:pentose-5-phosphate-3-epimerase
MNAPFLKAPSFFATDAGRLAEEVASIEEAETDILVAGSSVFGKKDPKAALEELIRAAERA